jgi:hypothetical protein
MRFRSSPAVSPADGHQVDVALPGSSGQARVLRHGATRLIEHRLRVPHQALMAKLDDVQQWASEARHIERDEVLRTLVGTGRPVYTSVGLGQPKGHGRRWFITWGSRPISVSPPEHGDHCAEVPVPKGLPPGCHRIGVVLRAWGSHRAEGQGLELGWAPCGGDDIDLVLQETLVIENPGRALGLG